MNSIISLKFEIKNLILLLSKGCEVIYMSQLKELTQEIIKGKLITEEEACSLINEDLEPLCHAANEIRKHFCKDGFDICTIINGKSGRCSENCKYCAQSSFYTTEVDTYPLVDTETLVKDASYNASKGVLRYSIVTSGKRLSDSEIDTVCKSIEAIHKSVDIQTCISAGLLDEEAFRKLKQAGISRVHNNLETSKRYFPSVCSTHSFDDKIKAIKAAKKAGLNVCSGGIMGLGETMEDRISMAFTLRELDVHSVPINLLNPIKGTPYEHLPILSNDEMRRIVAIFRFILPNASIRLAGGRGLLEDKGLSCFLSGANAAISGDMLTTQGISIDTDMELLNQLGYKVVLWNE